MLEAQMLCNGLLRGQMTERVSRREFVVRPIEQLGGRICEARHPAGHL